MAAQVEAQVEVGGIFGVTEGETPQLFPLVRPHPVASQLGHEKVHHHSGQPGPAVADAVQVQ